MLLLSVVLIVANCASADWAQEDADSYHSSSLNVNGNPPPAQTLTFPTPGCSHILSSMILTASGYLLGSSHCGNDTWKLPTLIFSHKEGKTTWTKEVNHEWKINAMVMSGNGQYALVRERWNIPIEIDPATGKTWKVGGLVLGFSPPIIQCPGSDRMFIVQEWGGLYYVDNFGTLITTTIKYDGDAPFYTNMASDSSGSRVTGIIRGSGDKKTAPRLVVWNVQVYMNTFVRLTQAWAFNFTNYPEIFSPPVFSRDGRVFVIAASTEWPFTNATLMVASNRTKQEIIIPSENFGFYGYCHLSITSDGRYAFMKGFRSELLVVSIDDQKIIRKTASLTAIDEENGVVFGFKNCQLIAFCLNNIEVDTWTYGPVCEYPVDGSSLILGKYPGGQRRLFLGLSNMYITEKSKNATTVQIIEPPANLCH